MNPITPAPVQQNALGVSALAPTPAPTPTQLPTAPTPVASPGAPVPAAAPDTAGTMSAIANYYQIPRQTAQIVNAGQAQATGAGQQFEAQKYQNQLNIEHEKAQLDPSQYKITKDPTTGGVVITNPLGQKVDLATYVNLTGSNPADALRSSTDPKDVKFVQAYNNLQDYIQQRTAAQNGDTQAQAKLADYYKANPGLQNIQLGQLSNAFMQQYGSYMGQPSNPSKYNQLGNAPNVSPTLQSQNNPVSTSPYYNPNYQTAFSNNQYQQGGPASLLAGLGSQLTTGQ